MIRSEIAAKLSNLLETHDAVSGDVPDAAILFVEAVRALSQELDRAINADAHAAREREQFGTTDFHIPDASAEAYLMDGCGHVAGHMPHAVTARARLG